MGTFYFIILVLVILAIYAFCSINGRDYVQAVEAGPTGKCDANLINKRSFVTSPLRICDNEGHPLSTDGMIRVVVCGDCMTPRGIKDNMQLLVEKVNNKSLDQSSLKKDDIVMIHLKDKNLNKIRVFDHFDDNGRLATYRFDKSGVKINSSRPHSIDSVVGIVRYKI